MALAAGSPANVAYSVTVRPPSPAERLTYSWPKGARVFLVERVVLDAAGKVLAVGDYVVLADRVKIVGDTPAA